MTIHDRYRRRHHRWAQNISVDGIDGHFARCVWRSAVLLAVGKEPSSKDGLCLIDVKEAVHAAAPRNAKGKTPRDNGESVVEGARHCRRTWGAGLYQVGSFKGDNWREWNGRFRDDVRRFVKGDRSTVRLLAQRMTGSPDIYGHRERDPGQSITSVVGK